MDFANIQKGVENIMKKEFVKNLIARSENAF